MHPRVETTFPCETRVTERYPRILRSPLVFTPAKFISSKNEHFRRYVIQADDGSNRIFVLSVYTGPTIAHTAVSSRDRIAMRILEGTSLFSHGISRHRSIRDVCHIISASSRTRARALALANRNYFIYVKRNPARLSRESPSFPW